MKSNAFLSNLALRSITLIFILTLMTCFGTSYNVEQSIPNQYLELYNMGDVKWPKRRQKMMYLTGKKKKIKVLGGGRPGRKGRRWWCIKSVVFLLLILCPTRWKTNLYHLEDSWESNLIQVRELDPSFTFPSRKGG